LKRCEYSRRAKIAFRQPKFVKSNIQKMPLFEYSCRACKKQFTFLSGVVRGGTSDARCPRCHSDDLQKLMSRVAHGRSDDERMEAVAEKIESRNLDDAGSMRQFAREMGSEISAESGVDMRDEMEAMIEAEARGENLEECDDIGDDDGDTYETLGGAASGANADDGKIY